MSASCGLANESGETGAWLVCTPFVASMNLAPDREFAEGSNRVRSTSTTQSQGLFQVPYLSPQGSLVDPRLRASNDRNVPSKLADCLSGMGSVDLPLRASNEGSLFPFLHHIPLAQGSCQTVLHCARRTSTFLSCAFREQKGWSGGSPSLLLFDKIGSPHKIESASAMVCARLYV